METPVVHGLAAQLKPKLSDEESVSIFINTLQPLFFDRMIGNVHSDFRKLITIGKRIENLFGSGNLEEWDTLPDSRLSERIRVSPRILSGRLA
ncbi:hypothetical protein Lal_00031468 [Lupinus albus]|nr:hypothetical protein Lal_00031468 [Lupinus albus]